MVKIAGLGMPWIVGATAAAAAAGVGGYFALAPEPGADGGSEPSGIVAAMPNTDAAPNDPLAVPKPANTDQSAANSATQDTEVKPESQDAPLGEALAALTPETPDQVEAALPEPTAQASQPAPGFDVVRVDAEGSALIAGSGPAGYEVEVNVDGAAMASASADGSGAFVALFDLPPSEQVRVVRLLARGPDGDEIWSEDSVILAPRQTAVADSSVAADSTAPELAAVAPTTAEPEQAAPALTDETIVAAAPALAEETVAPAAAEIPIEQATALTATATPTTEATPAAPIEGTETVTALAEPEAPAAAVETASAAVAGVVDEVVVGQAPALASAESIVAAQDVDVPAASAFLEPQKADAIVGDLVPDADPTPETVASAPALRSSSITSEAVTAATPAAVSTAAPTQGAQPAARADSSPKAPAVLLAGRSGVSLLQPSRARPTTRDRVAIEVISYSDNGDVLLEGQSKKPPPVARNVQVYLNNKPLKTVEIQADGSWRTPLPAVDSGVYTLRVDQVAADGQVVSRFETPFKREDPEDLARLVPTTPQAEGVSAALITVQPGYTLWGIASEQYGDGLQYVQVFEANKDQIRNPDLIYPGQVFQLPDDE